jgi:thiol-disulfide isomerase/thioredoxin
MRRLLIVLAASLLAACGAKETPAPAEQPSAPASRTVEVGKQVPSYTATWLDGSKFDLAGERGNVVMLNLWATWCGPCRYEIPELERLHARFARQRFKVIGVSVDEGPVDEVRKFVSDQKMTYPVALDPEGRLAVLFETTVLPTTALIDRTGKVVWKSAGIVDVNDTEMLKALESALN